MYINATGLKLSDWSGLLSDIKRLNLQYDSCKKRVVYNGKSEHGVILGIKKKQHSKEEDTNDIDFVDDDERSNLSKSMVESIKQENIELKMKLEMMQVNSNSELENKYKELERQNKELLEKNDKHFKQEMHYRQLCATMQNKIDKLSNRNDKFDSIYFENKLKDTINEINKVHAKPQADILDRDTRHGSACEINVAASVEHISTETEIDILDEINMNATIKPLNKSTAQDKTKTFKKFTKH